MERIDFNNLLSSSSESEDDIPQRRRVVKRRNNLFELDDIEFKKRFRLNKNTVHRLIELVEIEEPPNNKNQPIPKTNQVLICLRFYATGSFQINVGDHFNVSQPTISRIVGKVTRGIAALCPQFVKMPMTDEEKRKTVLEFFNIGGMPGIIGALDCSHIKIQSPGGNVPEVYRNRKGWFSINTQVVCDANLKINNIVARWPGSVHDSTIFNDSLIRRRFETNEFSPFSLVGDGGYACKVYLLTPLANPQTHPEQRYNRAQISTRNPVERLFGVWKRRFPCLAIGMRVDKELVGHIIVAVAVLHNLCLEERDIDDHMNEEYGFNDIGVAPYNVYHPQNQENTSTRDTLINTVFS